MNLKELKELWEKDCPIDDNHLGEEATKTPKLHSKYLNILIDTKQLFIKTKSDYDTLKRFKSRYYKGELTRDELSEYELDQYQYAKPLKAELEEILAADSDVIKQYAKVEYLQIMIYFLESVMVQIKSRDFQLKNGIQWRVFISGG